MRADEFVSRFDGVKRTGRNRWLAKCSAHEDRSPSLSIAETDDGRILIKCFAGCGVDAVCGAVGVELSDLFPPKPIEHAPREKRPFPVADVLAALADEADVLCVVLHDSDWGKPLPKADIDRAQLAIERIRAARSLALGR